MAAIPKTTRRWIYSSRPDAEVSQSNYTLEEVQIPEVQDGEILIKPKYLSVDPYMRIQQSAKNTWEEPHPLNKVQGGGVVGEVLLSKDPSVKVGDFVSAYTGWQEHAITKAASVRVLKFEPKYYSYGISILGMPGRTAFFGLTEAGKPKPGETLVVSGAAGAVGSIVGQVGKILGCRVVGIAGTDEKCNILQSELGFDEAINYKKNSTEEQMTKALGKACPNGVDIYYDNTGGYITDSIFNVINLRARIVICGQISQYNGGLDKPNLGPRFLHHVLYKRATIQGILARDFTHRMNELEKKMLEWIQSDQIKYRETFVEGFENLPDALHSMMKGGNIGKMLVKT